MTNDDTDTDDWSLKKAGDVRWLHGDHTMQDASGKDIGNLVFIYIIWL